MSYQLENIEAVKTAQVVITLNALPTATPYTYSTTKSMLNLNFVPDFVKVKKATFFDPSGGSSGLINVYANFVRDNDILCSLLSQGITASGDITPDLLHQFVDSNQLQFRVVANIGATTSATTFMALTLEFVKLNPEARRR